MLSFLSYIFFLSGLASGTAGSLDSQDMSYMYNRNSEIEIRSKLIYQDESPRLLIHLVMKKDVYEMNDYYVFTEYLNDYGDRIGNLSDTLEILDHIIRRTRQGFYFDLELQPPGNQNIFVLHFANRHSQNHYYHSVSLNTLSKSRYTLYNQEGLPYLHSWITPESEVQIKTTNDTALYAYYYSTEFNAANPPMQVESTGSPSMTIDSVFSFAPGEFPSLQKEGLYFVQSDTTSLEGLTFRFQNSYFPKHVRIDDIISSLRYFSTRSEWTKLDETENKKEALDNYWLSILRSPEIAKSVIRNYFDQVERANYYFTNYKEGWKTDMGMMYIILGPPDEVYRSEKGETWIYAKSEDLPKMKFFFMKRNSIFTDSHYVLERDTDFRGNWYKAVEMWRKGRFETLVR